MADTKLSAETAASALTGAELVRGVQSSSDVKITVDQFGVVRPRYIAGNWFAPPQQVGAGAALTTDTIRVAPLLVNSRITISDLGTRITTVSAGGHIRLGIYASSSSTLLPTGNALSSCVVVTDSGGPVSGTLGANVSLNAGVYWLAAQSDNSTVVCNGIASVGSGAIAANFVGDASISNVSIGTNILTVGYQVSGAYASGLPSMTSASFSPLTTTGQMPMVFFKVTSVP